MRERRRARLLLRLGVALFWIGLLVGLGASNFGGGVAVFALPRVALSAHLLALMQGTVLIAIGLLWPRLRLGGAAGAVVWLLAYGFLAAFVANLLAAVLGAGGSMLPQATGGVQGSDLQESVIAILLRTAAVAQLVSVAIIGWGLRGTDPESAR